MLFSLTDGNSLVPQYQAYNDPEVTGQYCEFGTGQVYGIKHGKLMQLSWKDGVFDDFGEKSEKNRGNEKNRIVQKVRKGLESTEEKIQADELRKWRKEFKNWF